MIITADKNHKLQKFFSNLVYIVLVRPIAFLNKYPVILKTKSFHLVYFGIFAALGVMASTSIFFFYLYAHGCLANMAVIPIALSFVVGDMVGVKALYFITLGKRFLKNPKFYLNETTMYNQGGMFVLTMIGIAIALKHDIRLLTLFDAMIVSCTFGLFLGRLGCYNYGCCFGIPTGSSVKVSYHQDCSKIIRTNPELKGVPLVPTQLYTAYFDLFMFIIFVVIVSIYPADGLITLIFALLFNGFRIVIQKYRFTEQSDVMNFSKTAIVYLALSLLIWLIPFGLNGFTFISSSLQVPWTMIEYVKFVFITPKVFISVILSGVISFLFYGVQGRQLGTHVNISDEYCQSK
jgi:prolipoprotein diacylglyceryltransferase